MWILLTLFYGLAKGARDGIKKKALEKSGVMEVLFLHTALAFLLTIPFSGDIYLIEPIYYFWIFLKSFVIFLLTLVFIHKIT